MSRREKNVPFCILRFSRFFPSLNSGEGGGAWKKLKRCGGTFFSLAPDTHVCTIPLEQALATIEFVLGWQLTVSTLKLGVQGGN